MKLFTYFSILFTSNLFVNAIVLNADDSKSVRDAAALIAHGVQALYNGNQTGGVLGKFPFPPYYWWESGGAWGSMMQYQLFSGDMSYHNVMHEAVCSQLGKNYDFIMEAQVKDTGNDDQAFWVFIAMAAAEHNYPSPPAPAPTWLGIVQNAFDEYVQRWNTTFCNGGLKWQFNPDNNGFHYKQSISNGAFFQISARLARYTGNQTYLQWAEKVWDWSRAIGLVDDQYNVYDGSDELINCTGIDHHQWSYNAGVYLYGAAILQNLTNSATWTQRTSGLLDAATKFISPFSNSTNIIFEPECETQNPMACNTDQQSMKAYLIRWLANTSLMAPSTAGRIGAIIKASAKGAAAACTGGDYGNTCGTRWYINGFDGTTGLGQQISALEVMSALLVNETAPPGTMPKVQSVPQSSSSSPKASTTTTSTTSAPWQTMSGTAWLPLVPTITPTAPSPLTISNDGTLSILYDISQSLTDIKRKARMI